MVSGNSVFEISFNDINFTTFMLMKIEKQRKRQYPQKPNYYQHIILLLMQFVINFQLAKLLRRFDQLFDLILMLLFLRVEVCLYKSSIT